MTFELNNPNYNIVHFVRLIGYKPLGYTERQELNCVRPLGADYPRFHLYIRQHSASVICNLHLDQKKPSYKGTTAHSGDYDSEVVREEAKRIQDEARKS